MRKAQAFAQNGAKYGEEPKRERENKQNFLLRLQFRLDEERQRDRQNKDVARKIEDQVHDEMV